MSGYRGSKPRRAAPQNRDRKPAEVEDIVSNGIAHFKVSAATPRTAYCHLSRLFFGGYDNHGQELAPANRVHSVELTGLGSAIATVIYVADNLVRGGVATYAKIETEFLDGEDRDVSRRSGPRIVIRLTKNGKWDHRNDEQLKRSKIYRKHVLNEDIEEHDEQ